MFEIRNVIKLPQSNMQIVDSLKLLCAYPLVPRPRYLPTVKRLSHEVRAKMLRVKSVKSDWLRIRNYYSAPAPKIGPSQSARLLVLTKRIAAPGNEDVPAVFR